MDDDEVVRPKVKRNRTAYTVVTSICLGGGSDPGPIAVHFSEDIGISQSDIHELCALPLVVCVQEVSGPHNRATEGGDKPVSNLQVAFEDRKIDTAFWGHKLATAMGQSKTGDVYRLDWMTLVPLGQNLFKVAASCAWAFFERILRSCRGRDVAAATPQSWVGAQ